MNAFQELGNKFKYSATFNYLMVCLLCMKIAVNGYELTVVHSIIADVQQEL